MNFPKCESDEFWDINETQKINEKKWKLLTSHTLTYAPTADWVDPGGNQVLLPQLSLCP